MAIESTSLVRLPPGSFGAAVEGGGVGGGSLHRHAHRQEEAGGGRTVLSSFSTDDFPGSYSKMLLGSARYFLVSTFLSGGSHSFLLEGRGGGEESRSLSSSLHGNQHTG